MNLTKVATLVSLAICLAAACRGATPPKERAVLQGVQGDVRGVVFSPDGKHLAVSTGQFIKIWDWETPVAPGKELTTIQGGLGAAYSPDGTLLAFPGQDETYADGLMVWDLPSNKKKLFLADDNVQSPMFSRDGKNIAAAVGNRVKVWKLAAGEELPPMKDGHKCTINSIVYSPDGKSMVSADAKGTLSRWELADSAPIKKGEYKRAQETAINSLVASNDGKWIAASTSDGEILLLDAATLVAAGTIKAHKDGLRVKSVAFSPDNTMLASACSGVEDLEIKLWNAGTKASIVAFVGHQGGVNCVAFSPDGKWLASGSDDKTVKIWEVSALLAMNAPPKPEKKKEKPQE